MQKLQKSTFLLILGDEKTSRITILQTIRLIIVKKGSIRTVKYNHTSLSWAQPCLVHSWKHVMLNSTRTKLSKQKFYYDFILGRFLWSHLIQELNPRSPNYTFIVTIHFRLYYTSISYTPCTKDTLAYQTTIKMVKRKRRQNRKKTQPAYSEQKLPVLQTRERERLCYFGSENSKWRFIFISRHGIYRRKKISCQSNLWGNIKSIYGYYRGTETA